MKIVLQPQTEINGILSKSGPVGRAGTITIGTVETLTPEESAYVTNVGTAQDAILNMGIPQGEQGNPGEVTEAELTAALATKADDDSVVHLSGNEVIAGEKTFSSPIISTNGAEFQKGLIAYGQYTPFPTGLGTYVASYVSPTYGARILGYNGTAYQDLAIGSMPTAGTFSMKSLANGDVDFGYNVNIAEDLGVTGDITATKFIGDGSELTDVGTKNVTQLGTCSTASATAEKAVTLDGFVLTTGVTIEVTFTNANTATGVTINVNSTGAKPLTDLKGNAITYVPANTNLNLFYNGTNWILLYSADYDMPDYTAGVVLTRSTSNQTFSNSGWLLQSAFDEAWTVYINDATILAAGPSDRTRIFAKVKKGDTYRVNTVPTNGSLFFYPYRSF